MADETKPTMAEPESVAGLSAEGLKGRQSVRVTFRLPPQLIELLGLVANQLGLKQKSLFDQLVEDQGVLERLAMAADRQLLLREKRRQKTFVVSRNSLHALEQVARIHGMPRDLLVEISIQRLVPVIASEQDRQMKRKEVLRQMEVFCVQGRELLAATGELLGEEDSTTRQLADLLARLSRLREELYEQVEQGRALEAYR